MQLALDHHSDVFNFVRPSRRRLDSHRERVLLIEPDAEWADVASESLQNHGYRVTWMRNAREALDVLVAPLWSGRAVAAEVVLLDVDRPELDVVGFMQLLSHFSKRMPPV